MALAFGAETVGSLLEDAGESASLTIFEMLDALELGIQQSRTRELPAPVPVTAIVKAQPVVAPPPPSRAAGALLPRIEKAGVSAEEFAAIFGVNALAMQVWLHDATQAPVWVQPALQMLEALGPAARRKVFNLASSPPPEPKSLVLPPQSQQAKNSTRKHPFSRIEDF